MAPDHPAIVVNDGVQVVDGRLLHLVLLADAELAQIQIPGEEEQELCYGNDLMSEQRPYMVHGCVTLPDGEVDHVVDLVPPDEAPEGEALELDDQDVGQTPQQQLLGGLAVLLALWTVPETQTHTETETVELRA